jgi:Carbohydrate esterase 2 N-terminal/GDSL-like Lipase/Acylhydrolase family
MQKKSINTYTMKIRILFVCSFILIYTASFSQADNKKFISFKHKSIRYEGRIDRNDSCAALYWSGSNLVVNLKGTDTLKAVIADNMGDNYLYIIIDGDSSNAKKIKLNNAKQTYTIAAFNDKANHTVQLFKITNTDGHITQFFGFELAKKAKFLKAPPRPKRTIEFFGNSITCGHGVDVPTDSTDNGKPEYFNNYRAYGAITARHFNAQYHCTAKSGIGIMVSWFNQVMPEIYDRVNPNDSTSKWDFKKFTPDIVVVNLFQNDSWLTSQTNHAQFKNRFGTTKPSEDFIINAYAKFIQLVRSKYPDAQIICCLGNMDATKKGSKWPGYIQSAVTSLNDKKVVTHFFDYKNTPGHPRIKEQELMAKSLIAFIEEKKYWSN